MSSIITTHEAEPEKPAATPTSDTSLLHNSTCVTLCTLGKEKDKDSDDCPTLATQSLRKASLKEDGEEPQTAPQPQFSERKKWSLLAIFAMAMFIDIWCYSAFFIFTDPIVRDLDIKFEQQSWVITSYAVTFGAFLLFWGRVSDLYSAKPVFTWGFLALGVLNLVISFLPDKYSFFVLRALAGIAGACLIPASYRLIVHVFPPEQLGTAFTLYGMSGAVSNVTGTVVAGFIMYIPNGGQGAAWRWFFRILAMLVIPIALLTFRVVPNDEGGQAHCEEAKWRRLDVIGSLLILSTVILLILGLTLGASYGWKTAGFLVPFLLSFVLLPSFFIWEAYLPESHALLPPKIWRIPNFTTFIVFALQIYPWWSVNFLALVETFTKVHGEAYIIAAVRLLPQGISAFGVTLLLTFVPRLVAQPRWTILFGMILGIVGYVLMTRPTMFVGTEYWRYLFPAFVLGSGGTMAVFTATNVGVMTSAPAEAAGVAGAMLQVSLQIGSAVGMSIQAGLLTVNPGGLQNPNNIKTSFYFQLGWCALWLVGFMALYRRPKKSAADEEGQDRIVVVAH